MTKRPFTFTVLRYVHDPLTGEFANVGLAAFFPPTAEHQAVFKVQVRRTIGRLRTMFPDLDRSEFLAAVDAVERAGRRIEKEVSADRLGLTSDKRVDHFARSIVGNDDSALQWSPLSGGVARDASRAFENAFARYISRYDDRAISRRSDDEVWKPVRQKLLERNVLIDLEEKTISGDGDQVTFSHAWKNGVWHVYEPVSLDLADAEGIAKKAHRWLGQFTSIGHQPVEPFRAHLIVGAPTNESLMPAYNRALKILRKSPGEVEVFEEADLDKYVDRIEDEVRAHSH